MAIFWTPVCLLTSEIPTVVYHWMQLLNFMWVLSPDQSVFLGKRYKHTQGHTDYGKTCHKREGRGSLNVQIWFIVIITGILRISELFYWLFHPFFFLYGDILSKYDPNSSAESPFVPFFNFQWLCPPSLAPSHAANPPVEAPPVVFPFFFTNLNLLHSPFFSCYFFSLSSGLILEAGYPQGSRPSLFAFFSIEKTWSGMLPAELGVCCVLKCRLLSIWS